MARAGGPFGVCRSTNVAISLREMELRLAERDGYNAGSYSVTNPELFWKKWFSVRGTFDPLQEETI